MNPAPDMAGQSVGRLLVIARAPSMSNAARWLCRCSCGREIIATGGLLRSGVKQSCGCIGIEKSRARATHGHTRNSVMSRTYQSWRAMIARCTKPNAAHFDDYGGRGIRVCERWFSFADFLADMGERPAGTSIERRDNDGNYEPGNCDWATATEQARNRRNSRLNVVAVAIIRHAARRGARTRDLAWAFDVHSTLVSHVLAGRAWRAS